MAQRNIEVLIGRLVTDEAFRSLFRNDAVAAVERFIEAGYELTPTEIAAVIATNGDLWTIVADQIDPRLQKASLGTRRHSQGSINLAIARKRRK